METKREVRVYPVSECDFNSKAWLAWDNLMISLLLDHGVGIIGVIKNPSWWGSTQFLVDIQIGGLQILSNRLCHDKDMNWYLEPPQLEDVPQYSGWKSSTKPDWIYKTRTDVLLKSVQRSRIERGYRTVLTFPPKFWTLVEEAVIGYVMAKVDAGELEITEVDLSKINQPGRKLYQKMVRNNELPGFEALIGHIDEEGHRRD